MRTRTHTGGSREEEGEEAKDAGQGSGSRKPKPEQAAQAGRGHRAGDRAGDRGERGDRHTGDLDHPEARFLNHVLPLAAPSALP